MNSFEVYRCGECKKWLGVASVMKPQWDKKCPKCASEDLEFHGEFNHNQPGDSEKVERLTGWKPPKGARLIMSGADDA
jgi:hypothetical protein